MPAVFRHTHVLPLSGDPYGRTSAQKRESVAEIRAALAANDTLTAKRIAHSLKGAAGNLGATTLADVAGHTETAIGAAQGVDAALETLSNSLAAVVAEVQAALPSEPFAATSNVGPKDPATVAPILAQLKRLLMNDDGEAAEFILDAQSKLSNVLTAAETSALFGLVNDFDYAGALRSLSSIAGRLSLNLG